MEIEVLKQINESELLTTVDTIDDSFEKHISGQLDVFDHILSEEEVKNTSLYSDNYFVEHNLKHERKFLDFIDLICAENVDENILIEIYLDEFSAQKILNTSETLDLSDKYFWLDLIKKFNSFSSGFVSTNDVNVIRLFFKLAIRELDFPIFHFENKQMAISGNFDLSFPVFFGNEELYSKYSALAKKVGLNIIRHNKA